MDEVYLIIDESGAKGYSDNQEKSHGELGLILGYLIPKEHIELVRYELSKIRNMFLTKEKLHITGLEPNEQHNLREEIYHYFEMRKIYFVYEAIHVQGFFNYHKSLENYIEQSKPKNNSNIAFSNNKYKKLLDEDLFRGLVGKAIGMYIDLNQSYDFHLNVICDNIDISIKKKFEKSIDEIINFHKPSVKKTKAFDKKNKQILKRHIKTTKDLKHILEDYSQITYSINSEDSELTLAADVLANSLYHHFTKRKEEDIGRSLNTKDAVQGYELESLIGQLWVDENLNYFADAIYMHPKQKIRKEYK